MVLLFYLSLVVEVLINLCLDKLHMDRHQVATEDCYGLLGVSRFATPEEIRDAYRKLALRYHPDKNKAENATSEFQEIVRAWETLRDAVKRAEYDRCYISTRVRTTTAEASEATEKARKRREEVDRDIKKQWDRTSTSRKAKSISPEGIARREKLRLWKATAKKEYASRLQQWNAFRERQAVAIRHYETLVRRYEQQLEDHLLNNEQYMLAAFTQAIKLSESKGQKLENHTNILSSLMEAKRVYSLNLRLASQASRGRLDSLLEELRNAGRSYEDEDLRIRQSRIQEALAILGPRESNTPLFSVIDRRQQAINYWLSLSRIQSSAIISCTSMQKSDEGLWHAGGNWERIAGEHGCERCGQKAFHVILDCGPAKCPGCGLVVCNDCHRDLELLREYEAWLLSENDLGHSLFSLDFEDGASPIESWDAAGVGRCWA